MNVPLVIALVSFGLVGKPASPPPVQIKPVVSNALLISDIHFNPLADPSLLNQLIKAPVSQWEAIFQSSPHSTLSPYGQDSNFALMISALNAAKAQGPYRYVICTGDLLCHDISTEFASAGGTSKQFPAFAIKTAEFVVNEVQKSFPCPVALALGNNDSTTGDYSMSISNSMFKALGKTIKTVATTPGAKTTFNLAGYYTFPNPAVPNQDIIVLNTVFMSPRYINPPTTHGPVIDTGAMQLRWLEKQLQIEQAKGRKASLVMHIPPGMDAYGSMKAGTASPMWNLPYATTFNALTQKYSSVLLTSFAGHVHMDDFRVMPDALGNPSLAIRNSPAVSPFFDNNPAFSVMTYDAATGGVTDIATHFVSLSAATPTWAREYRFSTTYGTTSYSASNLAAVAETIRQQGAVYNAYTKLYDASASPSPINSSNWQYYSCTQTSFTEDDYNGCISNLGQAIKK